MVLKLESILSFWKCLHYAVSSHTLQNDTRPPKVQDCYTATELQTTENIFILHV